MQCAIKMGIPVLSSMHFNTHGGLILMEGYESKYILSVVSTVMSKIGYL